jgi:LAO/AO transport system kinase
LIATAGSLLAGARKGDKRSIARLLTIVENDEPGSADILRSLYPDTGTARIVGITGPPGGGKSTLVSRLAAEYRKTRDRVAIVAVEPVHRRRDPGRPHPDARPVPR